MFSSLSLSAATLSVQFVEEMLFLHPTPIANATTQDTLVFGTVTVWVPKSRRLKALEVKLEGKQDLGWMTTQRPYESSITLERTVSLVKEEGSAAEGLSLEKGEHTFEFCIVVPCNSTPYERCSKGRVRHSVTARAKGIGQMGGEIVSEPAELFLMVNPGGSGASIPPPALDLKLEGLTQDLGPYTIALQSQHITVGGLLLLRFSLPSPPLPLHLISIKVKIIQHFTIRSAIDPTYVETDTDPRTVFKLDLYDPPNNGIIDFSPLVSPISPRQSSRSRSTTTSRSASRSRTPITPSAVAPLFNLAPQQPYVFKHLSRLPNDDSLRSSTMPGTVAGIHLRHEISLEVKYRLSSNVASPSSFPFGAMSSAGISSGSNSASISPASILDEERTESDGKREKKNGKEKEKDKVDEFKLFTVTRPLELYSCCCLLPSLTLPVYSLSDPHPNPSLSPPCICSLSLANLITLQGESLLREEGEGGITYADFIPVPKDVPGSRRGREERTGSERNEDELRNALELGMRGIRLS